MRNNALFFVVYFKYRNSENNPCMIITTGAGYKDRQVVVYKVKQVAGYKVSLFSSPESGPL